MVLPKKETNIWLALKQAIADIITTPALPVTDPADMTTPPNGTPFLMVSDVRNDLVRWNIAGDSTHSGTLLLTVQWPLSLPVKHAALMELAAVIAGHFPADRCIQHGGVVIRVTRDSDALASYVEGAYRVVPVRVFWSTVL